MKGNQGSTPEQNSLSPGAENNLSSVAEVADNSRRLADQSTQTCDDSPTQEFLEVYHALQQENEQLQQENEHLQQENEQLQQEIDRKKCAISSLNLSINAQEERISELNKNNTQAEKKILCLKLVSLGLFCFSVATLFLLKDKIKVQNIYMPEINKTPIAENIFPAAKTTASSNILVNIVMKTLSFLGCSGIVGPGVGLYVYKKNMPEKSDPVDKFLRSIFAIPAGLGTFAAINFVERAFSPYKG